MIPQCALEQCLAIKLTTRQIYLICVTSPAHELVTMATPNGGYSRSQPDQA